MGTSLCDSPASWWRLYVITVIGSRTRRLRQSIVEPRRCAMPGVAVGNSFPTVKSKYKWFFSLLSAICSVTHPSKIKQTSKQSSNQQKLLLRLSNFRAFHLVFPSTDINRKQQKGKWSWEPSISKKSGEHFQSKPDIKFPLNVLHL